MRRLPILLALLGLAAAACLVLRFDAGDVWRAMLSVGWSGAALLLLWQGVTAVLLGLAWWCVLPGLPLGVLIWGRMVRDGATVCLPFSPVGGYVIGARALTRRRAAWLDAAAGTVVDVTAELCAQLLFAVFGLAVLVLARPGSPWAWPIGLGLLAAMGLLAAAFTQRVRIGRVLHLLAGRLLGSRAAPLGGALERLTGQPLRLLAAIGIHLSAWFATGVGTWISLRLLHHPAPMPGVLALEALLDATVALAFLVPAAAGVQEAGYVGLGALFGVPPDIALSVSLLRRAREVSWGLPALASWQWLEVRHG